MPIDAMAMDQLFERYGFSARKTHPNVRVYVKPSGYFQNAEVVPLTDDASIETVLSELESSGFAARGSRFKSIQEAESKLFEGFFQIRATRERLRREYAEFCRKKSASLGPDQTYEYVSGPFTVEGTPTPSHASITSTVLSALSRSGPALVLLEAAAGYGKTCTAFEVMRQFLDAQVPQNPIFTELQRNRQARIFRYVLLDEMERNYQACGLSAEMVQREIRSGRIPLIIDGFDELLHTDREGDQEGRAAEVEPMLRTLSELLVDQSKVLVTTRRTAVLGEQFEEWLATLRGQGVSVHRYTLEEPEIEDWIGVAKRRRLEERSFPLGALANPVLLSYLRHASESEFDAACVDRSGLVDRYFTSLLDRERIRQELPVSAEKQLTILLTIARRMLELSSSSLPREELKGLVLQEHFELLREAIRSSPGIAANTPEELAEKLTDHALLDKKAGKVGGIGFVNDFVQGTLCGRAMLSVPDSEWFDESDMDKAVTAFRFRSESDRSKLWGRLAAPAGALEPTWQVEFDVHLLGGIQRDLESCVVQELHLRDIGLGRGQTVRDVVFIRCVFENPTFAVENLTNVGFVGCTFKSVDPVPKLLQGQIWFDADCNDFGAGLLPKRSELTTTAGDADVVDIQEFEKVVLQQFWPSGRPNARQVLQVRTLFQGVPGDERRDVAAAIDRLKVEGLVKLEDRLAILDFSRMHDIRRILGR